MSGYGNLWTREGWERGRVSAGDWAHVTFEDYERCRDAGHGPTRLARMVTASGINRVHEVCGTCGAKRKGTAEPYRSDAAAALPVFLDKREQPNRRVPCARCGSTDGTEEHHWAPRELFGLHEADNWPTSHLCPSCHRLWHKVINGGPTR